VENKEGYGRRDAYGEQGMGREPGGTETRLRTIGEGIRIVGSVIGLVVLVVGVFFAIRLFGAIYATLSDPTPKEQIVEKWAQFVGGDELNVVVQDRTYRPARQVAIFCLGLGTFLLVWVTLGIAAAGAKIISLTASDREAIKRILTHAFGAQRKPLRQRDKE